MQTHRFPVNVMRKKLCALEAALVPPHVSCLCTASKIQSLLYTCRHSAAQSNNPIMPKEVVTTAFLCLGLAVLIVMAHEDTGLQSIFGISRKQPFSILKQA